MEEPQRVQSSLQAQLRANKLLQSLSHFKRVVRFSGRKTKEDRDKQYSPYLTQHPALGSSNLIMEPFSSQPHLELGRSLNTDPKPARDYSSLRGESASTMTFPTGARRPNEFRDRSPTPISPPHSPTGLNAVGITNDIGMSPNVQPLSSSPSNPTPVIPHTLHDAKNIASAAGSQVQSANLQNSSTRSNARKPSRPLPSPGLPLAQPRPQAPSRSDVTSQVSLSGHTSEQTTVTSQNLESTQTDTVPPTSAIVSSSPSRSQIMPEALASPPRSLPKPSPLPASFSRIPPQPPKLVIPPINPRISLTKASELGSARLSPTVIARHPPLPIRNLPTLPVPTPKPDVNDAGNQKSSGRRAQLRNMPSLPLQGAAIDSAGQEEVDEGEAEDEEEEEIDEGDETEGEGETSQTDNSSKSEILASGINNPTLGVNGSNRQMRLQPARPSSSPSYHTAISNFSTSSYNGKRSHTTVAQLTQPRPLRSLPHTPLQNAKPQVPTSHLHQPEDHQKRTAYPPDVSIPRLDMSFLSHSSSASPSDSKGKGKARDSSEDHWDSRTPTASNMQSGNQDYHEAQTPIASRGYQHDHIGSRNVAEDVTSGSRQAYHVGHGASNPSSLQRSLVANPMQLLPSQVDSLRSPLSQTPTRSSTVFNPKAQRSKSMLYKIASHSMVDLRTIETNEQKRMMEEEVRMEEQKELVRKRTIVNLSGKRKRDTGKQVKKEDEDEKEEEIKDDFNIWETDTIRASIPPSPIGTGNAVLGESRPARKPSSRPSTAASHYLRRRRSMPMFDESSEPPPYPLFAPHYPKQVARDDEGKEKLPPYTNGIYLKAIMPRKMEFTKPGVQATDRKWRRVMCVLEGTVLRVYDCPPGRAGVGLIGEWWEKQVGAGDVSLQPSHSGGVSNIQIETRESRRLAEEQRDIERQIQRIVKAEGTNTTEGNPTTFHVPTQLLPQPPPQQSSEQTVSTSPKSRLGKLLKPGRAHARSRSEQVLTTSPTRTHAPRPSLNMRGNSDTAPPGRSRSPLDSVNETGELMAANFPRSTTLSSATSTTALPTPSTSSTSSTIQSSRGFLSSVSSPFTSRENSSGVQSLCPPEGPQFDEATSKPRMLYTNREIDFLPEPNPGNLIREYTMQHAESGLGHDYTKRKNVIRIRTEGEQFLLQARDVTGVIEWIEALQAATNIALDLDERPMPRGPLFPRRRRRRRPQTGINAIQETDEPQTGVAAEGGEGIMEATMGSNILLTVHI